MKKQFVEIDATTYEELVKLANQYGFDSVEKLLEVFAESFSTGCSVTLNLSRKVA